jgi:hypothetical protein
VSVEAIRVMPWHDLQAVFALQFAKDITTDETETVIRQRLSGLGEDGRMRGRVAGRARQLRASARHSLAILGGFERRASGRCYATRDVGLSRMVEPIA